MVVFTSLDDPQLRELLRAGAVGILPTDTIYGLVCDARNQAAVARLYKLKERDHKPGTIIAADAQHFIDLGVDETGVHTVKHLWPNPLSIVIDASPHLAYLDQEVGSLAVRVPADERIRELLSVTGPLATSSANHPGDPTVHTIGQAQAIFGEDVDFYVDGGNRGNQPASTVVRLLPGPILKTLRQGAITVTEEGKIV